MSGWWNDADKLEEMLERHTKSVASAEHGDRAAEQTFLLLQKVRFREQVEESRRMARATWWMALFVALASLAQVATLALALSRFN